MKLCISGIHPVKREQQSCCWHGGVIMGWCDLISCAGPTWDDVGTGHSWGGDIRWGSGVEETIQCDAHCFRSGDALKVRCPPAPPTQELCSISFCSASSPTFRGWYVFLANTTNKIDLLSYSDCVFEFFCAQASSWTYNNTFLHLSSLSLSFFLLQANYSSLWEF